MTTVTRCVALLSSLMLLIILSASPLRGDAIYNFESSSTGAIPVWNGAPPAGYDGWYTPPAIIVPGSVAASVYPYTVLSSSAHATDPAGGTQFLGLAQTPSGSVERAQHGADFSQGSVWTVSYDLGALNLNGAGNSYGTDWIGSFSILSTNGTHPALVVLDGWDSSAASSTWTSSYYVYDSAGNALDPAGVLPGSAWSGLQQNHWYSETTVWDFVSNRILSVSITDLTTNSTTTVSPVNWYMYGGAGYQLGENAIRFSGMASSNALFIDNVTLESVPEPATFISMGVGLGGLMLLRRRSRLGSVQ